MVKFRKILAVILATVMALTLTLSACSLDEDLINDIIEILFPTEETADIPTPEPTQAPTHAPPTEEPTQAPTQRPTEAPTNAPTETIRKDGSYTSLEDVVAYIRTYGKLPSNYITKKQANDLGWKGGDLWKYFKGKSIGGDRFGNYEGLLPEAEGRTWTECDIDYHGGNRGAKRLLFSNDGLFYYTEDHYESFKEVKP